MKSCLSRSVVGLRQVSVVTNKCTGCSRARAARHGFRRGRLPALTVLSISLQSLMEHFRCFQLKSGFRFPVSVLSSGCHSPHAKKKATLIDLQMSGKTADTGV